MNMYYLLAGLGYLCGSLMFARWLPLWLKGLDTARLSDDHNPGVFNAFRHAGMAIGIAALVADLTKGFVPVYIAARQLDQEQWLFALSMAAPVAGHIFPIFSRFRGGKGITVSFGVMLALWPYLKPFWLLAGLYIFFSVALVIDTHLWRSVVVYTLLAVLAMWLVPVRGVRLGCVLIGVVVSGRHLYARGGERISCHLLPRKEVND